LSDNDNLFYYDKTKYISSLVLLKVTNKVLVIKSHICDARIKAKDRFRKFWKTPLFLLLY